MSILPKVIYRFNAIPIKILMAFFTELEQIILKFVWKHKDPEWPKQSWERRTELEELCSLAADYTNKDTVIKTVWYWHRNRHMDQSNRIESPEINLRTYDQLIYDKGGKNIQWRKYCVFNKWGWENWIFTCKRMNLEYHIQK